ncbi:MAG TPA: SRPBCC domain-containing protein [Phenylobacterium sp.]|nr:SRPBCC domain-containing protein [Phenylobacterium sp.]
MAEAELGRISPSSDGRYTLIFERDLPHSQGNVWRAITAPELLGCWLSDAEVELRAGGRFRLSGQCNVEGEVLEVRAPDLFRWTWPHPDHPESEVEIALSAATPASSRVILSQTDLPKRHVLDVAAGWHTHLQALSMAVLGCRTPFDPERAAIHYRQYSTVLAL